MQLRPERPRPEGSAALWHDLLNMTPAGGWSLVAADPPWKFKAGMNARHAGSKYDLMSIEDIAAMPIRDIAAKDCWVILWATEPMREHAHSILRAWGAKYATSGVWVKRTKHGKLGFGTGFILRSSHEPFLIGKIGRPPILARNHRSVIEAPLGRHSEKPQEAYDDFARRVAPDAPKLDLFSRQTRPGGWVAYGNQKGELDAG